MTTLQDLLAQQKAIETQIAEIRKNEVADAIQKARELVLTYELTPFQVMEIPRSSKASAKANQVKSTVSAKYYDPSTGNSWSGRGLAPKWIANKDREQFLIAGGSNF